MDEILAGRIEKIHALKTLIIQVLERDRQYGCKPSSLKEQADKLTEEYDALTEILVRNPASDEEVFRSAIPHIENAYLDWRAIHQCFSDTLRMAYQGLIPKSNMLMDGIHSQLERSVGEPINALYTDLQSKWRTHLGAYPWDAFLSSIGGHLDADEFEATLKALSHGDEFDIEDAAENLTGPLRHLLATYIREESFNGKMIKELKSCLWQRPEIVVANDYWQQKHRSRLMDILHDSTDSPSGDGFARVRDFFEMPAGPVKLPKQITSFLANIHPDERTKYFRCLALHPSQNIRRYAVTNVNISGFWKSLTPQAVPCSTILSLLERVVGSKRYDENFQKIFFNSVYKRLFCLTSRSDVLYARGIIRIFTMLDFFLEDVFFEKLMRLIEYVEVKENYYKIIGSIIEENLERLKKAKQTAGSIKTESPEFGAIPPVLLRKLAMDGHFWFDLAAHPVYKIAIQTVRYINTPDRVLRITSRKDVNQEVLRAIGKNRQLFSTRNTRLALLSNPRTPPSISMEYVPDLDKNDVEMLLRKSSIHPELRLRLRSSLQR